MSLVFTNGCFDIIHRGHLELLNFCGSIGTKVVVGLNSDASVKRIKGAERPVNNQDERKFLLECLKPVDKVIIFDEDTPENLINLLKPDIIVKGGDYRPHEVVGNKIGRVVIFNYVEGYSTTKKIKDITNR